VPKIPDAENRQLRIQLTDALTYTAELERKLAQTETEYLSLLEEADMLIEQLEQQARDLSQTLFWQIQVPGSCDECGEGYQSRAWVCSVMGQLYHSTNRELLEAQLMRQGVRLQTEDLEPTDQEGSPQSPRAIGQPYNLTDQKLTDFPVPDQLPEDL